MARHLAERFVDSAGRYPDRVAVSHDGEQLTYGQLLERAGALSRFLQRRLPTEAVVAITQPRGTDLITAIVATSMADCTYLPLDRDYPTRRLQFCLADSNASLTIGDPVAGSDVPAVSVAHAVAQGAELGGESVRPGAADDAAYIIYTSGSTGTPKGVVVENGNVLALFDAIVGDLALGSDDVWTMFHSPSFDFSVWEMWGALLHGGRLVVVDGRTARSPEHFVDLVQRENVTVLSQTPTAFGPFAARAATAGAELGALRLVVFGGERLEPSSLADWTAARGFRSPELVNMYGITETTVHATVRPLRAEDVLRAGRSPIGRPLADLDISLLDADLEPVADGQAGEMVLTGPGVARGYLNRADLSAERFPTLPIGPGGAPVRCYRSGDLARYEDGELVYLGRNDAQLKVRGYRVEPHEVEAALVGVAGVRAAAVVVAHAGPDDDRLAAFLVDGAGAASDSADAAAHPAARETAIRAAVGEVLPAHMCPAHLFAVPELPRTANGKIDSAALAAAATRYLADVAATDVLEDYDDADVAAQVLARARRVLGLPRLGAGQDIFEAGATSLGVVRLIAELNIEHDVQLAPVDLVDDSTVRALAELVVERVAVPA